MRQHIHWTAEAELPYILNLDSNFKPITRGVELEYKRFDFKGGEPHFQITTHPTYSYSAQLIITQRYNKIGDLFDIILANDAARRMGFKSISLILPYFPAARQDRVCNEGEPLTIKVFTDMINSCGFDSVTILCPHSEVTPALINNVVVLDENKYIQSVIRTLIETDFGIAIHRQTYKKEDNYVFNIVCPDAGAGKRVQKTVMGLSKTFPNFDFNLIRCEKVRDVKDGSIKEFFVDVDDLGKHTTIIIDDINSMGGTFIGLGNKLREKNCGKLMLFTAHADCIDGVQRIVENFDHYYTTNSKRDYDQYTYTFSNRFTCLKFTL
jgi:ribose-phosphate pyrophosphokinase